MDSQQEFDSSSVPKANYRKISFAAESSVTSLEFSPITLPQNPCGCWIMGTRHSIIWLYPVSNSKFLKLKENWVKKTIFVGKSRKENASKSGEMGFFRALDFRKRPNRAFFGKNSGKRQKFGGNCSAAEMSRTGDQVKRVRCIEVEHRDTPELKSTMKIGAPVLDVCWNNTGEKVFIASCDEEVLCWDLASNSTTQVGHHGAPVRICHWVTAPNFSCLMTGSWDKTLKFWDTRSPSPMMVINLPERCSYASVDYPMAVVGTTNSTVVVYHLGGRPQEYKQARSSSKYQYRCAAIFKDERCQPAGFALGTVEGRVIIEYASPYTMKDKFIFKCRSYTENGRIESIRPINHMAFHPFHGTLATVSSDGFFSYWDINAKKRLLQGPRMEQSITRCAFSETGLTFAYSVSYDWSKGPTSPNLKKMNHIYFRSCFNEIKPRE